MTDNKAVRVDDIKNARIREEAIRTQAEIREKMNNPNKSISFMKRKLGGNTWYYYAKYHVPKDVDHETYEQGRVGTAEAYIAKEQDV